MKKVMTGGIMLDFTLCPQGNFSCFFVVCRFFFKNQLFFEKILSEIPSECQTDWIQIRPDQMSGLIWIQSVCKSYQQTTLGDKRVNASVYTRAQADERMDFNLYSHNKAVCNTSQTHAKYASTVKSVLSGHS